MSFFFFNVYWCLACVSVHHNMCVWCQNRESDSQELELQTDVSCHMGSGNHNWVSWQSSHFASPTSFPGIEPVKQVLQLARKPPESVPFCLHTLEDEDSHQPAFLTWAWELNSCLEDFLAELCDVCPLPTLF